MRSLFDFLPSADLPDAVDAPGAGATFDPPDDGDLIRPAFEEELERYGEDALAEAQTAGLAKHLLWTFGPEHRALPFLLQMRCEIEDDRLVTVDTEIGWLHQGLEKQLEGTPWDRAPALMQRLHPQNPCGYQLAFTLALERHFGIAHAVPRRAQLWRSVLAELSRIREHLHVVERLLLGHARRDHHRMIALAAQRILALLTHAGGTDDTPVATFGGLSRPLASSVARHIRTALTDAMGPVFTVVKAQSTNPALWPALRGRGTLERRTALSYGITGPTLRATGISDDIRQSDPYFSYAEFPPHVPVREAGDTLARLEIRLEEALASSELIEQLLLILEDEDGAWHIDGDAREPPPSPPPLPNGRSLTSVELAGGEFSILVESNGGDAPTRVRLRTPSFFLASALGQFLVGCRLDEVVPVLASLGLVGNEVDR